MAKKVKELKGRVEVSLDSLKIGDRIFIDVLDVDEYEVLDIGSPFILILNIRTNFASLYKATRQIYKNN